MIINLVQNDFYSYVAADEAARELNSKLIEGVVARTDPYLYNERGQRIMFKLKGKDLL
jgi:hypothetical protein